MLVSLMLSLATATAPLPPEGVWVQHRDQQDAWRARREGRMLPLREIEARVTATMRGAQYLGSSYDGESGIYTLKFLRDGTVIWVEVDGRSGQILGRTGN